jgi:peptide deformylase
VAILDILRVPDPRLKRVSAPVQQFDEALRAFAADLEATRLASPAAVGIAAPQVGCFQRLIIINCSQTRRPVPHHGHLILVNPEITHWEGQSSGREGCLSVPDYTGNVLRATRIQLKAQDLQGTPVELILECFEARAAQHEVDHLDGFLFLDRVVSRRTDLFQRKA